MITMLIYEFYYTDSSVIMVAAETYEEIVCKANMEGDHLVEYKPWVEELPNGYLR